MHSSVSSLVIDLYTKLFTLWPIRYIALKLDDHRHLKSLHQTWLNGGLCGGSSRASRDCSLRLGFTIANCLGPPTCGRSAEKPRSLYVVRISPVQGFEILVLTMSIFNPTSIRRECLLYAIVAVVESLDIALVGPIVDISGSS